MDALPESPEKEKIREALGSQWKGIETIRYRMALANLRCPDDVKADVLLAYFEKLHRVATDMYWDEHSRKLDLIDVGLALYPLLDATGRHAISDDVVRELAAILPTGKFEGFGLPVSPEQSTALNARLGVIGQGPSPAAQSSSNPAVVPSAGPTWRERVNYSYSSDPAELYEYLTELTYRDNRFGLTVPLEDRDEFWGKACEKFESLCSPYARAMLANSAAHLDALALKESWLPVVWANHRDCLVDRIGYSFGGKEAVDSGRKLVEGALEPSYLDPQHRDSIFFGFLDQAEDQRRAVLGEILAETFMLSMREEIDRLASARDLNAFETQLRMLAQKVRGL